MQMESYVNRFHDNNELIDSGKYDFTGKHLCFSCQEVIIMHAYDM